MTDHRVRAERLHAILTAHRIVGGPIIQIEIAFQELVKDATAEAEAKITALEKDLAEARNARELAEVRLKRAADRNALVGHYRASEAKADAAEARADKAEQLVEAYRITSKAAMRTLSRESEANLETLATDNKRLTEAKDGAYAERNQCVALIVRMALALRWRAGVRDHEDKPGEAWESDWRSLVCIDLPTGQVSWHFHDSEKHLLAGLPTYPASWDGHDAPEKYRRVNAALTPRPPDHDGDLRAQHRLDAAYHALTDYCWKNCAKDVPHDADCYDMRPGSTGLPHNSSASSREEEAHGAETERPQNGELLEPRLAGREVQEPGPGRDHHRTGRGAGGHAGRGRAERGPGGAVRAEPGGDVLQPERAVQRDAEAGPLDLADARLNDDPNAKEVVPSAPQADTRTPDREATPGAAPEAGAAPCSMAKNRKHEWGPSESGKFLMCTACGALPRAAPSGETNEKLGPKSSPTPTNEKDLRSQPGGDGAPVLVTCDHCPDYPHPLNDDGTICKNPRLAAPEGGHPPAFVEEES